LLLANVSYNVTNILLVSLPSCLRVWWWDYQWQVSLLQDRAVTELLCIAEVPFYLPCVCDAVAADVLCRAAHRRVWHWQRTSWLLCSRTETTNRWARLAPENTSICVKLLYCRCYWSILSSV